MALRLVDSGWDRVFDEALAADVSALRIVCPFIKESVAAQLVRHRRPPLLQVITRFNRADFYDGVSDLRALRLLFAAGAAIRGVRDLHAKLYLFGEQRAIVTSANLTTAALTRNHEFGLVADDPEIVAECRSYFDDLWSRSGNDLTLAQLDQYDEELGALFRSGFVPAPRPRLLDDGVPIRVFNRDMNLTGFYDNPPEAFVKFFGQGHERAHRSKTVVDEITQTGSHWACSYPAHRRPRVRDGATMFLGRLVGNPADTLIYGRAVAVAHQKTRDDASPEDIQLRPWKEKWPRYIRVHHPEFIAGTLSNGVSLHEMMNELGADAFASTLRHRTQGDGNTNPRLAFQQQPSVRLSDAGLSWLRDKLEMAFQEHGTIGSIALRHLDWPTTPSNLSVSSADAALSL